MEYTNEQAAKRRQSTDTEATQESVGMFSPALPPASVKSATLSPFMSHEESEYREREEEEDEEGKDDELEEVCKRCGVLRQVVIQAAISTFLKKRFSRQVTLIADYLRDDVAEAALIQEEEGEIDEVLGDTQVRYTTKCKGDDK